MNLACYNDRKILAIDSNGHIWDVLADKCIADTTEYISATTYNSSYFAIDKNDHLWVWGNNSSGCLGTGNGLEVNEPEITTTPIENKMKDIEFINVGNGKAESKDGYMYIVDNNQWKKSYQTTTYLKNQGIAIKQEKGKYAVGENGKLYYGNSKSINNGIWQCVTDIEDSDLYNAYYNDGVGIKEIVEIENTNVIIKDTDGYYWINGSNKYGLLGTGGAEDESKETFVKIVLDGDLKIGELVFFDETCIYLKDENGTVWSWGNNQYCMMGISDSTPIVKTPHNWGIQAQQLIVNRYNRYDPELYSVFVLDTDGAVWSCGYGTTANGKMDWSDGALGKSSRLLGKVNNSDSMGTIVKLTVAADCCYAINDEGELWVWGDNAYGALGYETSLWRRYHDRIYKDEYYYTFYPIYSPVCVTKKIGSVYYQKTIKDVISLTGYYSYKSEINKGVYTAGSAEVLVITTDNEVYRMGDKSKEVNDQCKDMYTGTASSCSQKFPQPRLMNIEGNITNIKYVPNRHVYLQTDTGAVYRSEYYSFNNLTKDEYRDLSLDEVYYLIGTVEKYILNKDKHTITYEYETTTQTYTYPASIDADKVYIDHYSSDENTTIYVLDKNGDLWIKGRKTGMGTTYNGFACVTKIQYSSEPVWNKIRGRWNLISRRF